MKQGMTPEEYKALREKHAACQTNNTARQAQKTAARIAEGRCHMPGTQCDHIREYSCMQCGFGWAEESGLKGGAFA